MYVIVCLVADLLFSINSAKDIFSVIRVVEI